MGNFVCPSIRITLSRETAITIFLNLCKEVGNAEIMKSVHIRVLKKSPSPMDWTGGPLQDSLVLKYIKLLMSCHFSLNLQGAACSLLVIRDLPHKLIDLTFVFIVSIPQCGITTCNSLLLDP